MAIFSSGVFAVGQGNKKNITNKSNERYDVNFESKIYNIPKEKLSLWPCFVCIRPGGIITYATPCGKTITLDYAAMHLIDLLLC